MILDLKFLNAAANCNCARPIVARRLTLRREPSEGHWIRAAKPWQIQPSHCRLSIGLKRDPVHPVLHPRLSLRGLPCADGRAGDLAPCCGADAQAHRGLGSAVAHRHPGRQGPHARRVRDVDPAARNEHQGVQGQGCRPGHRDQPQPRGAEAACRRAATATTIRFPNWKPRPAGCAANSASARSSCSGWPPSLPRPSRAIEARALELDKMGRLYDEASLTASNRQIDLVVRETEVEKLAGDMQLLRGQRKDAERRMQDIAAENKAARDALKGERKKVTDLEKRLERMLDHAHRPRGEARPQRARAGAAARATERQFRQRRRAQRAIWSKRRRTRSRLEAELADMTLQMSTLLSGAKGGDIEKAMAKLNGGPRAPGGAADRADPREQETAGPISPPTSGRRPRIGATSGAAMRCCANRSTIWRPRSCR